MVKESEIAHGHNLADQASTAAEKAIIVKQKMKSCKKKCKKAFDWFVIET